MGMKPNIDLDNLIKGCIEGNRLAQKYLYERYFSTMMNICHRYIRNHEEALEVLNTGFLKIFTKIHLYQNKGSFEGWMKRIMVNTSIDMLRQRSPLQNTDEITVFNEPFVENEVIDRLSTEELMNLLNQLSKSSKTVFSLFIVDGYSHKEIGTMLNISENTSKWHLAAAKKEFKRLIEERLFVPILS
jgi:RNA polymerase sigma factor (sigma-70 family)